MIVNKLWISCVEKFLYFLHTSYPQEIKQRLNKNIF